ncbi:REP-associated tyrosine transposase [Thiohalomonas denitrificans]|uniref:REP-associated tyrosine transposase n=1 Tax=Thiohalomonas denitrificans TaxID=415747 RepID=UPI0026F2B519|nr:transposase [Thiohalomonas denitrificans]
MSQYRRAYTPGGSYFFTVVTWKRRKWFEREADVEILRAALRKTMGERPFIVEAAVILPDHMHTIWRLPDDDWDYSGRWREIKKRVSLELAPESNARNERQVWQKRFWEHQIRNERDWRNHVDYIHYNPVKHDLATRPADWPWSSFHRAVNAGWYEPDWGATEPDNIRGMKME